MTDLILSEKYKDFLRCRAPVEFLEGTTAAGKTTVGLFKFMLRVAESPQRLHVLAGLDQGTVEKNIITKELGILDDFGDLVEYRPQGGREASMRCDYLLATLNPDDPGLPVYAEYINHSRPLPKWEKDTPPEILKELNQEPKQGWVHWFFSFEHNAGLSTAKIQRILSMVPPGTKLYKNKVLGLRGRATGLVFHLTDANLIGAAELRALLAAPNAPRWVQFSCGVDTSYSQQTEDTFAFVFDGILTDRRKVTLAAEVHSNKERARQGLAPLAPSDIPPLLVEFLERQRSAWGFARVVYIDTADQATITECVKYRRQQGCIYDFVPAWKKMPVIDRINLESGWLAHGAHLIVRESCAPMLREYDAYSWREDKDNLPEDRNDHTINAEQYAWLPYKDKIGAIS